MKDQNEVRQMTGLTFGQAIERLKEGKKVCRAGWNSKGMYLFLQQGYPVNGFMYPSHPDAPRPTNPNAKDGAIDQGPSNKSGQMLSHIVMKTAGDSQYWGEGYNDYVPWLASQTDILSNDWQIVE